MKFLKILFYCVWRASDEVYFIILGAVFNFLLVLGKSDKTFTFVVQGTFILDVFKYILPKILAFLLKYAVVIFPWCSTFTLLEGRYAA